MARRGQGRASTNGLYRKKGREAAHCRNVLLATGSAVAGCCLADKGDRCCASVFFCKKAFPVRLSNFSLRSARCTAFPLEMTTCARGRSSKPAMAQIERPPVAQGQALRGVHAWGPARAGECYLQVTCGTNSLLWRCHHHHGFWNDHRISLIPGKKSHVLLKSGGVLNSNGIETVLRVMFP